MEAEASAAPDVVAPAAQDTCHETSEGKVPLLTVIDWSCASHETLVASVGFAVGGGLGGGLGGALGVDTGAGAQ